MADIRESFPTLENASGVGVPLSQSNEGDAAAGKVGSVGFAFKDSDGDLVLPQLDAEGKLPVTMDTSGTIKRAYGTVAGSASEVDVATLALTASKTYIELGISVSCRRGTKFQIKQIDDAATTVLYTVIVDSGQYTMNLNLPVDEITAGGTGTQSLKVTGLNFNALSDMYATVTVKEVS